MKISMQEFDIAYRILEKIDYGVIQLKNDILILNNNIELKKYDGGTWSVYRYADAGNKIYPNFLEAFESALIKSFMEKLSVALYDENDYTKNSIDLSE